MWNSICPSMAPGVMSCPNSTTPRTGPPLSRVFSQRKQHRKRSHNLPLECTNVRWFDLVFDAFCDQCLRPCLQAGDVVVLDNLGAHRASRIEKTANHCEAPVILLPPYSPHF